MNGILGEILITELVIFTPEGSLKKVHRMWSAMTHYVFSIDQSHSRALEGVRNFLASTKRPTNEDELCFFDQAKGEHEILSDADSYLVKSMLFLLLVSFNEFALKNVYRLCNLPESELPPRNCVKFLVEKLTQHGAIREYPDFYRPNFQDHIDPVRNNFAHGDWENLMHALEPLDLTKAYMAVHEFYMRIKMNLLAQGFDV